MRRARIVGHKTDFARYEKYFPDGGGRRGRRPIRIIPRWTEKAIALALRLCFRCRRALKSGMTPPSRRRPPHCTPTRIFDVIGLLDLLRRRSLRPERPRGSRLGHLYVGTVTINSCQLLNFLAANPPNPHLADQSESGRVQRRPRMDAPIASTEGPHPTGSTQEKHSPACNQFQAWSPGSISSMYRGFFSPICALKHSRWQKYCCDSCCSGAELQYPTMTSAHGSVR